MSTDITNILLQHFDKDLLYAYFGINYNDLLYHNINLEDFTSLTGTTYENLLEIIKELPQNEEYAIQALKNKNIAEMRIKASEELTDMFDEQKSYNAMVLKCKIFDKDIVSLIDTGATKSVISLSFIKDNNLEQYVDYHTELHGIGVSSKFISSGVIWHTYLYMGEQCFPILLTVHDLPQGLTKVDMIIGMDILSMYDIKLVPKDKKLILNDIEIICNDY